MLMRRAATVAITGLLPAAVVHAAGDPAPPTLPERLLKIELRCAADTPPLPPLPPRPGDRVVGTSRPAAGVTVGTAPRPAMDSGPAPMDVVIANGRVAALRWAGPQVAWDLVFDGAYAAAPAAALASRPARPAQADPLVAVRLVRRVQSLQVQPQWPGGERPVRIGLSWSAGDAEAGAPAVRTVVDVPFERWMPLARVQSPDAAAAGDACALEIRVRPAS